MLNKGYKVNCLEIISNEKKIENGYTFYLCRCVCGNERYVHYNVLKYKSIKDCGCKSFNLSLAKKEYLGKKYNSLKIIDLEYKQGKKNKLLFAKCKCDCGNIKENISLYDLEKGHTKSCGCLKTFNFDRDYKNKIYHNIKIIDLIERKKNILNTKVVCQCHCGNNFETRLINLTKNKRYIIACPKCNNSKYPLFNEKESAELKNPYLKLIYYSMKRRCYSKNSKDYKYYGLRGIIICDEWLEDSNKFVDWALKNGYQKGLEIDRIDNNGNYEPSNCRWVDRITQNNNKRCTKKYKIGNDELSLSQISRKYNINYRTLLKRVNVKKMSLEEAISKPIRNRR